VDDLRPEFSKTYSKKAIEPYAISLAWSADGGTLFAGARGSVWGGGGGAWRLLLLRMHLTPGSTHEPLLTACVARVAAPPPPSPAGYTDGIIRVFTVSH
jgi:hypothetical protein